MGWGPWVPLPVGSNSGCPSPPIALNLTLVLSIGRELSTCVNRRRLTMTELGGHLHRRRRWCCGCEGYRQKTAFSSAFAHTRTCVVYTIVPTTWLCFGDAPTPLQTVENTLNGVALQKRYCTFPCPLLPPSLTLLASVTEASRRAGGRTLFRNYHQ
ncbi:uncharacterized protein LY79DRAFT_543681 [Colletotrichum navitas]|uniref:Uncharacterized protein n=1 Tax=Colletotrichum navitas TaxID=681940 RepID=A0AAD8V9K1_9PEZI|nr:uncharacterized protein LY79DRAFT_543681 [Colletotrichum navitas]KAK1596600.1 hypothetical protein LY79DRAFT_543681 [Colletotrichum navitas]